MKKTYNLSLLLILATMFFAQVNNAYAQTFTAKGTVVDVNSEAIIGALVVNLTSQASTLSDVYGNFEIEAEAGQQIRISYSGYATQIATAEEGKNFNIVLEEDVTVIDEVVVIGYGTLKKSDLTGAVESVKADEITKRSTANAAEALQGLVAGVNVQKLGGRAGEGVTVKIRGVNTFGDNEPLYIIDGFPGDINTVNPQDIQNMEVLKDGAASAIYGSVAANGVIIVTTKNGKAGKISIDINSSAVFTNTSNRFDLLDANEYVQVHRMMYENAGASLPAYITSPGDYNTDWQDEIFRPGFNLYNSFSIRGGSEDVKFSVSANLTDEAGVVIANDFRQRNVRGKISAKKNIFQFDANVSYNATRSAFPNFSLKEAYMISPLVPVFDENEEYGYGLTDKNGLPNNMNVIGQEEYSDSYTDGQEFNGNLSLALQFTDWLQFKSSYSYSNDNTQFYEKEKAHIADPKVPQQYPYYGEERVTWSEEIWDNVLSFDKDFGKHSLNLMVGMSMTMTASKWASAWVEGKTTIDGVEVPGGFLDENFSSLDAGAGGTYGAEGSMYQYNRLSYFGRVNYNYDNRYLLQATYRADGSSKFGPKNRWGYFPSVAVGWRIEQEDFMQDVKFVDMLKLRASWGQLGNENALGYYDFQSRIDTQNWLNGGYVQGNGNPWPGSIAKDLENQSLSWETTESINVGLDYGFLRGLTGSIEYYNTATDGLLITRRLPGSAGLNDPTLNVGKIRNSGVELTVNWADELSNGLGYNVGLNLTTIENRVEALADQGQVIYGDGLRFGQEHAPTATTVGQPIGAYYLYTTGGIFQSDAEVAAYVNDKGDMYQESAKAGDIKFIDVNGDGVINEDDKSYMGSGIPKVEFNFNVGLNWKGIDFSMLIGGGFGHELYNGNRFLYESMSSGSNFLASSLDAWTPTNTNTDVPRAVLGDPNANSRESDRFLESGDFIRLRNIQLGYTFPKAWMEKIHIERLRVYLSGDNLLTITDYSGVDPEFGISSPLNTGVDNLIYPMTCSVTVGLQITF